MHSAHILHLAVSHRPVFLLNSCLSLFSAAALRRHPFSRSYGVILPSSLTMLLPSALGSSPHPPVSVYGTGALGTIAAFLDAWLTGFPTIGFGTRRTFPSPGGFCLPGWYRAWAGLSVPGSRLPRVSPHFCPTAVQESPPVVHRLRLPPSP